MAGGLEDGLAGVGAASVVGGVGHLLEDGGLVDQGVEEESLVNPRVVAVHRDAGRVGADVQVGNDLEGGRRSSGSRDRNTRKAFPLERSPTHLVDELLHQGEVLIADGGGAVEHDLEVGSDRARVHVWRQS